MLDIELYLIRHAETVMNTTPHLVGGRSNETELTPMGIEQSKRLGRYLLSKGIIPVKVYSSPAVRTMRTAEYALSEMGLLDRELLICDELQELSQGDTEGKLRAEVYTEEVLGQIAMLGKNFKFVGGESMNDVGTRMNDWVTRTFANKANGDPERVFVFTHGGAIKYFASHLENWSHQQTYKTVIDNASINLFTRQNGEWQVEYLNDVSRH